MNPVVLIFYIMGMLIAVGLALGLLLAWLVK